MLLTSDSSLSLRTVNTLVIMVTWLMSTEAWLRSLDRRLSRARRDHRKLRLKYITKLGKTKHILGLRIKRKLERNQELSESERAYVLRPPRGEHTDYTLSQTKHGLPSAIKILELESTFGLLCFDTAMLTKIVRTQPKVSGHHVQIHYPYWTKTYQRLHYSILIRSERSSNERPKQSAKHQ